MRLKDYEELAPRFGSAKGTLYDPSIQVSAGELSLLIFPFKFREGFIAMVGAYIDESFDTRTGGVFSLAAYVARTEEWLYGFEPKWDAKLSEHGIPYFRATDCENGSGPFAQFRDNPLPAPLTNDDKARLRHIKTDFVDLVLSQSHLWGFGVNVIIKDFNSLVESDSRARDILTDDPFMVAYQVLLTKIGTDVKGFNDSQPSGFRRHMAGFVIDERNEIRYKAMQAHSNFQERDSEAGNWIASLTFADDRKVLELQGADNLAYEIRKNCLNDLLGSPRNERVALKRLKRKLAIVYRLDRRSLEVLVRHNLEAQRIRPSDMQVDGVD